MPEGGHGVFAKKRLDAVGEALMVADQALATGGVLRYAISMIARGDRGQ
jgi:hypothetical protein